MKLAGAVMLGAVMATTVPGGAMAREDFPTAAVAADHVIASEAGVEILRKGGNAVDAAVATSFCLSVVRPYSCGIGGGGFMIVHLKDDPRRPGAGPLTTAINYREQAGAWARPDYYEGLADPDASTHGGKAVAIPGNVAGLLYALERYGTMDRRTVLGPAIRAAEQGFAVDKHYVDNVKEVIEWLEKEPSRPGRFPFLWDRLLRRGKVAAGDVIRLPEQADVLMLIAEKGAAAFYEGPVAEAIVEAVRGDGGEMTADDLRGYKVEELRPLEIGFRGRRILSMPPPSSGGIAVAHILGLIDRRAADLKDMRPGTGPYLHLVAEATKHAFADRARWLGDTAYAAVPVERLLSGPALDRQAALIEMDRTRPQAEYGTAEQLPEDGGTSHFCVIDERGNAVSCTETINLIFGSLVPVPRYGFILNNEMDDFTTRRGQPNAFGLVQSDRNLPAPGKRPLSCMTPVMVFENRHPTSDIRDSGEAERVVLMAGASGGPRIITGTVQASLHVLLFDLGAIDAVGLPRFHHQWEPDVLQLEDPLRGGEVEADLKARGHVTGRRETVGAVQLIRAARTGPGYEAASDPRKGGRPAGY
ncbi:MAG: gamma-glutamyltransferase [Phycisphaerales bacterium]|nr:gamma-glutamyltransferase [Phycisphaerales bacterium]